MLPDQIRVELLSFSQRLFAYRKADRVLKMASSKLLTGFVEKRERHSHQRNCGS